MGQEGLCPASVRVLAFCGALQVGVVVSIVDLTERTAEHWSRQKMMPAPLLSEQPYPAMTFMRSMAAWRNTQFC